jgi:hypothetical protein
MPLAFGVPPLPPLILRIEIDDLGINHLLEALK